VTYLNSMKVIRRLPQQKGLLDFRSRIDFALPETGQLLVGTSQFQQGVLEIFGISFQLLIGQAQFSGQCLPFLLKVPLFCQGPGKLSDFGRVKWLAEIKKIFPADFTNNLIRCLLAVSRDDDNFDIGINAPDLLGCLGAVDARHHHVDKGCRKRSLTDGCFLNGPHSGFPAIRQRDVILPPGRCPGILISFSNKVPAFGQDARYRTGRQDLIVGFPYSGVVINYQYASILRHYRFTSLNPP